ncbi:MAG: hypothetical protein VKI42_05460 [Synechococcaceae cyanobacterium]|nr:hypothetical protein [Synechococcaceae cyanobacterium]
MEPRAQPARVRPAGAPPHAICTATGLVATPADLAADLASHNGLQPRLFWPVHVHHPVNTSIHSHHPTPMTKTATTAMPVDPHLAAITAAAAGPDSIRQHLGLEAGAVPPALLRLWGALVTAADRAEAARVAAETAVLELDRELAAIEQQIDSLRGQGR